MSICWLRCTPLRNNRHSYSILIPGPLLVLVKDPACTCIFEHEFTEITSYFSMKWNEMLKDVFFYCVCYVFVMPPSSKYRVGAIDSCRMYTEWHFSLDSVFETLWMYVMAWVCIFDKIGWFWAVLSRGIYAFSCRILYSMIRGHLVHSQFLEEDNLSVRNLYFFIYHFF